MWAWAHQEPADEPTNVDASTVLAVMVAHNGEQWLPRTLVALARLDQQPGRLIAVDAGSSDGSRKLLDKGAHDGLFYRIVDGQPDTGFGANVAQAIEAATSDGFQPRYLWLLHDDSAPTRHALTELLVAARTADADGRKPAIVVPKLLHPKRRNHPDQMSAVGESIAPSGLRVRTVEAGDIDQHQEEATAVLGASTAGLLITMAAWHQLGGLDAAIPLFRDGVDLGWRANAAGLLVRTCPNAALRHVEAGRVGLRRSVLAPDSAQADQAAGMAVVVMHSERPGRTIARLRFQSLISAFGYLIGKSPSLAAGQLRASAQIGRDRVRLIQAAEQRRAASPQELPAGLLPDRGWGLRRFVDRTAGTLSDYYHDLTDDDDGGMIDELTGDDFAGGRRRARFLSPTVIGMLVMLVACLVASRNLMHFGLLSGPALLPAPANLAQAWANWAQSDPGMIGSNASWLGLIALGSTLTFGQPDWFATLLVLGGPALAAWSGFHYLRAITGPGWWTPTLACLWGALLPLTGATGQGSADLVILAITLPLLGIALRRWQQAPVSGAEGLRAPATVALLIGVLATSMPWTWLIGLVTASYLAIRRRDLRGAVVACFGPLILLGPWLPRLIADPGRLLLGADPATRLAGSVPDALHVLTGTTYLPAAPLPLAAAAIGLIWVVAIIGVIGARGADRWHRGLLLAVALVTSIIAVAITRFVVDVARVGVRPDPTGWLLIGLFALLILAAHGLGRRPDRDVDDSAADLERRAGIIKTRSLLGATLAVSLGLAAGWWITGGTAELERDQGVLPTYVTGVQNSWRDTRTLMVDLTAGTARFNITSANNPAWGRAESPLLSTDPTAATELLQAAQQFAQGQPADDLSYRLTDLGVGHVWLRGASSVAISSLSSAPQLDAAVLDANTVIFTVTPSPSRAMLRIGDQQSAISQGEIGLADQNAQIVLSSPADPDWQAEIDGQRLPKADSGDWRQAWQTEGKTGSLRYWLGVDVLAVSWQPVVLVLLLVLAAPTAQRAHAPRRAQASGGVRRNAGRRR